MAGSWIEYLGDGSGPRTVPGGSRPLKSVAGRPDPAPGRGPRPRFLRTAPFVVRAGRFAARTRSLTRCSPAIIPDRARSPRETNPTAWSGRRVVAGPAPRN